MLIPVSTDPWGPTERIIRGTVHDHKRAEFLKAYLLEALYRAVRDELRGNRRYVFTAQDAHRDEYRIREAVEPIAEAAFKCAVNQNIKGSRWSPPAVLSRIRRETSDPATLTSQSMREALKSWLRCGSRTFFAEDGPNAAPRNSNGLEPWWDTLVDPAYPVVIRAADAFEDVVLHAMDDPDGTNASRRFAASLIDALEKNDLRLARKRQTVTTAVGGALATGSLAGVELAEPVHQLLPATTVVGVVFLAFVLWLTSRTRGTPTEAKTSELSIAIDSIRDWVINVERLPDGEEKRLSNVFQQQLLPSIEFLDLPLLKAMLRRVNGLLDDRAEHRPSYQPAKLDSALRELHRVIDPRPPAVGQLPAGPQPAGPPVNQSADL